MYDQDGRCDVQRSCKISFFPLVMGYRVSLHSYHPTLLWMIYFLYLGGATVFFSFKARSLERFCIESHYSRHERVFHEKGGMSEKVSRHKKSMKRSTFLLIFWGFITWAHLIPIEKCAFAERWGVILCFGDLSVILGLVAAAMREAPPSSCSSYTDFNPPSSSSRRYRSHAHRPR